MSVQLGWKSDVGHRKTCMSLCGTRFGLSGKTCRIEDCCGQRSGKRGGDVPCNSCKRNVIGYIKARDDHVKLSLFTTFRQIRDIRAHFQPTNRPIIANLPRTMFSQRLFTRCFCGTNAMPQDVIRAELASMDFRKLPKTQYSHHCHHHSFAH